MFKIFFFLVPVIIHTNSNKGKKELYVLFETFCERGHGSGLF